MPTGQMIPISLVGFSSSQADDLTVAMNVVMPHRFQFTRSDVGIEDADPEDAEGILVVAIDRPALVTPTKEVIRRLRMRRFHWGPVQLLARGAASDADPSWAIYQHPFPPDLRALAAHLDEDAGVSPAQQTEIIRSACVTLLEDIAMIRRAASGRLVTDDRIREAAAHAYALLAQTSGGFDALRATLDRILTSPSLSTSDTADATGLVVEAERLTATRMPESPLPASLHQLANVLRLSACDVGDIRNVAAETLGTLNRLSARCDALRRIDQQRLREGIERTAPILNKLTKGGEPTGHAAYFHDFARTLAPIAYHAADVAPQSGPVQRIIVIEDDFDWRRAIVNSLRDIGLGLTGALPVQEAECAVEARALLRTGVPALVLVDLGLPERVGGEIAFDTGLGLIRDAVRGGNATQIPHRFIILTGAENHSEIVRSAVSLGIAATRYIQKHPGWDADLRPTVRLALQSPAKPPVIGLFPRTARVVRLGSNEFNLDYPDWCLLAVLSEHPGRWLRPVTIARRLTHPPYELKPGGTYTPSASETPKTPFVAEATDFDADEDPTDNPSDDDGIEWLRSRLADYVYAVRQRLNEAYTRVHGHAPTSAIVESSPEFGYRLNAKAVFLDAAAGYRPESSRVPTVLIVEDDPDWGEAIRVELVARGFQTRHVMSVETAQSAVREATPDLMCLDLEVPLTESERLNGRIDARGGVTLLTSMRAAHPELPIAILSSVAWKDDLMLDILRQGVYVDDYVQKAGPESVRRVAASLGRLWQEHVTSTNLIDWDPDTPRHAIEFDKTSGVPMRIARCAITLKGGPLELLRILARTPNRFVSRTELIEQLWPDPDQQPDDPDNALDLHVSRLRRSISAAAGVPGVEVICSSRGVLWLHGNVQ